MSYETVLEKLGENSKEQSNEAVRLLLKIADNILHNPKNEKIRTLLKSNATVSNKILQVSGCVLCLKLMGFNETETCFTLPLEDKLEKLKETRDTLLMWKESISEICDLNTDQNKPSGSRDQAKRPSIDLSKNEAWGQETRECQPRETDTPLIKPVVLPPLISLFSNRFLHKIEEYFHHSLQYESKELQLRAKKLIPLVTLEEAAQRRLRTIQEHIKKNKLKDPDISIQDMLILELLQWFKEDFFSWVDSPSCSFCHGKTHFSHMSNDHRLLVYTDRVELHKCEVCHQFTPFHRYNDLNILLETRRGRCGEWANTFTLFCRAMGWDARFVVDEGDHVWTEVYSTAQNKWLHCDPCENICDKPLTYESGWKKNITYVMAYSADEVQDVTWRYTSHHKEVLKKRKYCTEDELVSALIELRKRAQENFSEARKKYLTKRLLMELVELMVEKKPNDEENQGRQSGNAAWRLARGEIQEDSRNHVWTINTHEVVKNSVTVRYSAALDKYEYVSDGVVKKEIKKWNLGAFKYSGVLRKEEKDWKQVYLSRREGTAEGSISWSFEMEGDLKKIDSVVINFPQTTFENGRVVTTICSGDDCQIIPNDKKMLTTNKFAGKKRIVVTATLSGGKGDVAWQHAQLFRQAFDSEEYPFTISFIFK